MRVVEPRNLRAEVRDRLTSDDVDLWTLTIRWTHGIYGTHEEETYFVWTRADGDNHVIDRTGYRTTFDPEAFPWHAVMWRAISRVVEA